MRHEYGGRIAPIGEREAAASLAIHKTLKATGASIDPPDALIAATALANGWTVDGRHPQHQTHGPNRGSGRQSVGTANVSGQ
ncbi:hypothetical protein AB0I52_09820 [Streptomyces sp. NPDC050423]|uniref:type II toxin-antitoxin system VapC family toxin n=1 Tax=Streptomyces sp. NPDC050423 TaxID=3155402 RepID=UPI00341EF653